MLDEKLLGIIVHLIIVLTVIAATTVVTIVQHGNLPTSVGGLFGAALGISGTSMARSSITPQ